MKRSSAVFSRKKKNLRPINEGFLNKPLTTSRNLHNKQNRYTLYLVISIQEYSADPKTPVTEFTHDSSL